ncbi:hypothetical protein DLAC_10272 [Tieghemostelium lacteum]|uniref:CST complex subunit CTC1 n=1 Tax=Tieghemostelium lacteum TaxID=361077 RepID=A0A151Z532_TIELA|nr:hypothetical protein DLAC_10272 [Tieghemostelium lacteum]|eukprot:KYQ89048.1 hypothetical protein DLAC_10272 [Tieghemostelium lacteum]
MSSDFIAELKNYIENYCSSELTCCSYEEKEFIDSVISYLIDNLLGFIREGKDVKQKLIMRVFEILLYVGLDISGELVFPDRKFINVMALLEDANHNRHIDYSQGYMVMGKLVYDETKNSLALMDVKSRLTIAVQLAHYNASVYNLNAIVIVPQFNLLFSNVEKPDFQVFLEIELMFTLYRDKRDNHLEEALHLPRKYLNNNQYSYQQLHRDILDVFKMNRNSGGILGMVISKSSTESHQFQIELMDINDMRIVVLKFSDISYFELVLVGNSYLFTDLQKLKRNDYIESYRYIPRYSLIFPMDDEMVGVNDNILDKVEQFKKSEGLIDCQCTIRSKFNNKTATVNIDQLGVLYLSVYHCDQFQGRNLRPGNKVVLHNVQPIYNKWKELTALSLCRKSSIKIIEFGVPISTLFKPYKPKPFFRRYPLFTNLFLCNLCTHLVKNFQVLPSDFISNIQYISNLFQLDRYFHTYYKPSLPNICKLLKGIYTFPVLEDQHVTLYNRRNSILIGKLVLDQQYTNVDGYGYCLLIDCSGNFIRCIVKDLEEYHLNCLYVIQRYRVVLEDTQLPESTFIRAMSYLEFSVTKECQLLFPIRQPYQLDMANLFYQPLNGEVNRFNDIFVIVLETAIQTLVDNSNQPMLIIKALVLLKNGEHSITIHCDQLERFVIIHRGHCYFITHLFLNGDDGGVFKFTSQSMIKSVVLVNSDHSQFILCDKGNEYLTKDYINTYRISYHVINNDSKFKEIIQSYNRELQSIQNSMRIRLDSILIYSKFTLVDGDGNTTVKLYGADFQKDLGKHRYIITLDRLYTNITIGSIVNFGNLMRLEQGSMEYIGTDTFTFSLLDTISDAMVVHNLQMDYLLECSLESINIESTQLYYLINCSVVKLVRLKFQYKCMECQYTIRRCICNPQHRQIDSLEFTGQMIVLVSDENTTKHLVFKSDKLFYQFLHIDPVIQLHVKSIANQISKELEWDCEWDEERNSKQLKSFPNALADIITNQTSPQSPCGVIVKKLVSDATLLICCKII